MQQLSLIQLTSFKQTVWKYYCAHKRDFAWRQTTDPYKILVSELMLQQTQTARVIEKYDTFLLEFPDLSSLADAELADVLCLWQGLGYNRRAKYLWQCAQEVMTKYDGIFPDTQTELQKLPGIGPYTASAVMAFAFNKSTVFIETNIRTVFLHSFFNNQESIDDKQLLPLIAATVDEDNPREWYYALMDYGVFLKQKLPNPNRKSKHYTKQSKFEGSDRQIRGAIIRILTDKGNAHMNIVLACIDRDHEKIAMILNDLVADGLVYVRDEVVYLGQKT